MTHAPAWDLSIFRLVNGRWTCAVMDVIAPAFQPSWVAIAPAVLLAAWIWRRGGADGRRAVIAALLAVALADLLAAQIVKPWVERLRPSIALEDVRLLVGKKSGFGFPSNHAANLAAAATAVALLARRFAWPIAALALFVGYTRVYVGVHYPLDVIGGYCVGVVAGTVAVLATQKFGPTPRQDARGKPLGTIT
ncbi:MAG: phosphatase PAP2 family protein [Deltaproteobacteria bacterium]|nr:phosphatase PAP2 family protein [Deltaproteobacteria bacterium]